MPQRHAWWKLVFDQRDVLNRIYHEAEIDNLEIRDLLLDAAMAAIKVEKLIQAAIQLDRGD